MFYFDEDHMENGFEAPEGSDHEEDHALSKKFQFVSDGRGRRSSGHGLPSEGTGWSRSTRSGSANTSSTGSFGHIRISPDVVSKGASSRLRDHYDTNRGMDHSFGCEFDDLDDCQSESEEQPAELVPLGLRSLNMSGGKNRHRRKKMRNNFLDYYKLTDEHLGSGAYASVRTGVSIATGKEFAIKLVDKHEEGHTRSRIMREVETFNMCKNHPNIVQLHEWFEDSDYFYMIFEKMRGGPLLNHIQRKGFFTEQEASKVTRDIASALRYLHDHGIAHRDVKPENVLCYDIDHVSPVKLCDLDLASKAASSLPPKLTSVNSEPDLASPVGSAEFMAPEVVDAFVGDALKYDKRCDMWSLGVIVYIMICGYPPFYGQCWRENCGWDQGISCSDCQENLFKRIQRGEFDFPEPEWDTVSSEAKDLISHLLVKNVRDRFTADDVLKHPWIRNGAPDTKLQTPGNLIRNDSARDFHQMQENFNAMNRLVARLSTRVEQQSDEKDDGENASEKYPDVVQVDEIEKLHYKEEEYIASNNNNVIECAVSPPVVPPTEVLLEPVPFVETHRSPVKNQLVNAQLAPSRVLMPPPPLPQLNHVDVPPLHVQQMMMANTVGYANRVSPGLQQGVAPLPFHPNQLINMSGILLYPSPLLSQPFFNPDQVMQQQMFEMGVQPQQFMAPPPPNCLIYQPYNNCRFRRSSIQHFQAQNPYNKGVTKNGMLSVQSAAALTMQSAGNTQQVGLETCQTAMARQDSKTDVRPQARETQVNV